MSTTGLTDGKHNRGRPRENRTEGMAQWLHRANNYDRYTENNKGKEVVENKIANGASHSSIL